MKFKPLDQAFDKQRSEATRTESKEILNKAHSQNYTGSLKIFTNWWRAKEQKLSGMKVLGSGLSSEEFECLNARSLFLLFF